MTVGKPKTAAAVPLALEPTWCALFDRDVLQVAVLDSRRGVVLAAAHTSLPHAQMRAAGAGLGALLTARTQQLATTALAAAIARAATPKSDALHLAFDLGRAATRLDEGYGHCVGTLLEEKLAPTATVQRASGDEALATLRFALSAPPELVRPTRRLVLRWFRSPDERAPRTLPATLTLAATLTESVFGHHVPTPELIADNVTPWRFTAATDGRIDFALSPAVAKLIDAERATLQLADWPQVAKIDRAWVYLDRGRAWGLKMADRLVANASGQPVKGHVVRFFGPEAGIKSPRGHLIREGAILYIRKGQRATKVGLEFRADPKTFPAPWPPRG